MATTPPSNFAWANNQLDKLPEMAADLVSRRVAVIVCFRRRSVGARGKGCHHEHSCRVRQWPRSSRARSRREHQSTEWQSHWRNLYGFGTWSKTARAPRRACTRRSTLWPASGSPMLRKPIPSSANCVPLLRASGGKSRFSPLVVMSRSMRPSRSLCEREPMR